MHASLLSVFLVGASMLFGSSNGQLVGFDPTMNYDNDSSGGYSYYDLLGDEASDPMLLDPAMFGALDAGLAQCGLNTMELLDAANSFYTDDVFASSTESSPDILNVFQTSDECSATTEAQMNSALEQFHTCSGWDLGALVETLPSALFGNLFRCAGVLMDFVGGDSPLTRAQSIDKAALAECASAEFGDNPFGDAIRNVYLYPDKTCGCFTALQTAVPDCYVDQWPIPLFGGALQTVSCLIGEGCGIIDPLYEMELLGLDSCIPDLDSAINCGTVLDGCADAGSGILSLPTAWLGAPLPDAFQRIASDQPDTYPLIIGRYNRVMTNCAPSPNIWDEFDEEGSSPESSSSVNLMAQGATVKASSTDSQGSFASGSFLGGVAVGLLAAAVLAMGVVLRRKMVERRLSSGKNYDAVELVGSERLP